jgi:hypothetical protein
LPVAAAAPLVIDFPRAKIEISVFVPKFAEKDGFWVNAPIRRLYSGDFWDKKSEGDQR